MVVAAWLISLAVLGLYHLGKTRRLRDELRGARASNRDLREKVDLWLWGDPTKAELYRTMMRDVESSLLSGKMGVTGEQVLRGALSYMAEE